MYFGNLTPGIHFYTTVFSLLKSKIKVVGVLVWNFKNKIWRVHLALKVYSGVNILVWIWSPWSSYRLRGSHAHFPSKSLQNSTSESNRHSQDLSYTIDRLWSPDDQWKFSSKISKIGWVVAKKTYTQIWACAPNFGQ